MHSLFYKATRSCVSWQWLTMYNAGAGGTFQRYDPTKTLFRNVTKINPYLLQDVVNCYKRFKTVCRSCYYKHKSHDLLGSTHHCRRCKRVAHPLVLIPASQMCDNLFGAKLVAVPAPPKNHMTLENKLVCMYTVHVHVVYLVLLCAARGNIFIVSS